MTQTIVNILLLSVPLLGVFYLPFLGVTLRVSDFVVYGLSPVAIAGLVSRERPPFLVLFFLASPAWWVLVSLSEGTFSTAIGNNAKDYLSYGLLMAALSGRSFGHSQKIVLSAIVAVIYVLYGTYAIVSIWTGGVVLHSLSSDEFRSFNLNNWGFVCCQFGIVLLGLQSMASKSRDLEKWGFIARLIGGVCFAGSFLSLSRSAIFLTIASICFLMLRRGVNRNRFVSILLLVAVSCVAVFVVSLFLDRLQLTDEYIGVLSKKIDGAANDFWNTRVWEINGKPMLEFGEESSAVQFAIGTIDRQSHSSIVMMMFYGGWLGVGFYILAIFFTASQLHSSVAKWLLFVTLLNDVATNGTVWHPPIGFVLVIGLLFLDSATRSFIMPNANSKATPRSGFKT